MEVVSVRDGLQIPVRRTGVGKPIIFLHGWAIGSQAFDAAHDRMGPSAQVITYDQRGIVTHGLDDQPTVEQLAQDLDDILTHFDFTDVTLVGWSMGSLVAWLALTSPHVRRRVGGMVSIDMTPRVTNDASWTLGFSDGRRAEDMLRTLDVMRTDWPRMVSVLRTKIYSDHFEPDPDIQEQLFRPVEKLNPEPLAAIWQSMAVQDLRRDVARLNVPTLLLHGLKSQLYSPEAGRYLHHLMPDAILHQFANAGHAPHLEEPDAFYEILGAFHQSPMRQSHPQTEFKKVSNR
ncbi:MAG: alpha/beta fold hydrolase [Parvularcula sp.]